MSGVSPVSEPPHRKPCVQAMGGDVQCEGRWNLGAGKKIPVRKIIQHTYARMHAHAYTRTLIWFLAGRCSGAIRRLPVPHRRRLLVHPPPFQISPLLLKIDPGFWTNQCLCATDVGRRCATKACDSMCEREESNERKRPAHQPPFPAMTTCPPPGHRCRGSQQWLPSWTSTP